MEASTDMAAAGGGIVACVIMAVVAVLALASFAFWLWMLIDAITRIPSGGNTKLIWILVILFTSILGALIYFFVQRPKNPPKT
jgi:hypothetical protein